MALLRIQKNFNQRCKEGCIICCRFTYNKETHECCGRSCKNWCSLLAFYLLYVGFTVSGFFGILFLMMHIIESQGQQGLRSKLTLFTDASPALEIFPKVPKFEAPMFWYSNRSNASIQIYVDQLNKLLTRYENLDNNTYVDCSKMKRKANQYCAFMRRRLGPCAEPNYGYDTNQPCLFLRLNKLIGWDPKSYRPTMSIDEEDTIGNEIIMVTCKAITHYDADHLGPISYYPGNGFFEYFFPYDGSEMYITPLIALQFPKIQPGFVIGVKCKTYNVGINRNDEAYYTDSIYMYIDN